MNAKFIHAVTVHESLFNLMLISNFRRVIFEIKFE